MGEIVRETFDQPTVLPEPDRLEVVHRLPLPEPRQDDRLFLEVIRRDQEGDRPSHRLGGRVAEEPLRALVPGGDNAVEVLAHDRVV